MPASQNAVSLGGRIRGRAIRRSRLSMSRTTSSQISYAHGTTRLVASIVEEWAAFQVRVSRPKVIEVETAGANCHGSSVFSPVGFDQANLPGG
jgi:hypothetical protein